MTEVKNDLDTSSHNENNLYESKKEYISNNSNAITRKVEDIIVDLKHFRELHRITDRELRQKFPKVFDKKLSLTVTRLEEYKVASLDTRPRTSIQNVTHKTLIVQEDWSSDEKQALKASRRSPWLRDGEETRYIRQSMDENSMSNYQEDSYQQNLEIKCENSSEDAGRDIGPVELEQFKQITENEVEGGKASENKKIEECPEHQTAVSNLIKTEKDISFTEEYVCSVSDTVKNIALDIGKLFELNQTQKGTKYAEKKKSVTTDKRQADASNERISRDGHRFKRVVKEKEKEKSDDDGNRLEIDTLQGKNKDFTDTSVAVATERRKSKPGDVTTSLPSTGAKSTKKKSYHSKRRNGTTKNCKKIRESENVRRNFGTPKSIYAQIDLQYANRKRLCVRFKSSKSYKQKTYRWKKERRSSQSKSVLKLKRPKRNTDTGDFGEKAKFSKMKTGSDTNEDRCDGYRELQSPKHRRPRRRGSETTTRGESDTHIRILSHNRFENKCRQISDNYNTDDTLKGHGPKEKRNTDADQRDIQHDQSPENYIREPSYILFDDVQANEVNNGGNFESTQKSQTTESAIILIPSEQAHGRNDDKDTVIVIEDDPATSRDDISNKGDMSNLPGTSYGTDSNRVPVLRSKRGEPTLESHQSFQIAPQSYTIHYMPATSNNMQMNHSVQNQSCSRSFSNTSTTSGSQEKFQNTALPAALDNSYMSRVSGDAINNETKDSSATVTVNNNNKSQLSKTTVIQTHFIRKRALSSTGTSSDSSGTQRTNTNGAKRPRTRSGTLNADDFDDNITTKLSEREHLLKLKEQKLQEFQNLLKIAREENIIIPECKKDHAEQQTSDVRAKALTDNSDNQLIGLLPAHIVNRENTADILEKVDKICGIGSDIEGLSTTDRPLPTPICAHSQSPFQAHGKLLFPMPSFFALKKLREKSKNNISNTTGLTFPLNNSVEENKIEDLSSSNQHVITISHKNQTTSSEGMGFTLSSQTSSSSAAVDVVATSISTSSSLFNSSSNVIPHQGTLLLVNPVNLVAQNVEQGMQPLQTVVSFAQNVEPRMQPENSVSSIGHNVVSQMQTQNPVSSIQQNVIPQMQNQNPVNSIGPNVVPQMQPRIPISSIGQKVVPNMLSQNPISSIGQNVVPNMLSQNPISSIGQNVVPNMLSQNQISSIGQNVVPNMLSQNPISSIGQNVVPQMRPQNPVVSMTQSLAPGMQPLQTVVSFAQNVTPQFQHQNPVSSIGHNVVPQMQSQNQISSVGQNMVPQMRPQNPIVSLAKHVAPGMQTVQTVVSFAPNVTTQMHPQNPVVSLAQNMVPGRQPLQTVFSSGQNVVPIMQPQNPVVPFAPNVATQMQSQNSVVSLAQNMVPGRQPLQTVVSFAPYVAPQMQSQNSVVSLAQNMIPGRQPLQTVFSSGQNVAPGMQPVQTVVSFAPNVAPQMQSQNSVVSLAQNMVPGRQPLQTVVSFARNLVPRMQLQNLASSINPNMVPRMQFLLPVCSANQNMVPRMQPPRTISSLARNVVPRLQSFQPSSNTLPTQEANQAVPSISHTIQDLSISKPDVPIVTDLSSDHSQSGQHTPSYSSGNDNSNHAATFVGAQSTRVDNQGSSETAVHITDQQLNQQAEQPEVNTFLQYAQSNIIQTEIMASYAQCTVCPNSATFLCSNCQACWYCSPECQVTHWATHQQNCVSSSQRFVNQNVSNNLIG